MKAVFDREALLHAFQIASSVLIKKTPKVVLKNVKLSANKKVTVLQATDLESVGITIEVRGVQVEEPGDVLLSPDHAGRVIADCTSDEIRIEGGKDGVEISAQFSNFELPGSDPDEYPTVQTFEGIKCHAIAAGQLAEMIRHTIFSVATESARYALTGILWELKEDHVRLVATDGKSLAMVDGKGDSQNGHATTGTQVVPTKVMQLLAKSLGDRDEQVLVSFHPNHVLFKVGRTQIYGRLVEGRYPTYREVFPKKTLEKIPLPVGPLALAVKQAGICTDAEMDTGVYFHFEKGTLELRSSSSAKGKASVSLPVAYQGQKASACFDPVRVAEYLRVLNAEDEITLELVSNNTVSMWTAPGNFSFILVPLAR